MERFLNFFKRNLTYIIIIWITFTVISPYLFTREWNIIDFSGTGEIGDTIGGVTAPIINILNAILIYIAFTEQLKANNLIKKQLDDEKLKESERLENIKQLIFYDLKNNIRPNLSKIKKDVVKYIEDKKNNSVTTVNNYVDFNSDIYNNIQHSDLLKIFEDDFKKVTQIYSRVNFISSMTPLNISKIYPTDKDGIKLIKLTESEYNRIYKNHNEKIFLILGSLESKTIPVVENEIKWILEKESFFKNTDEYSGL